jgi:8-oxo-dGTP diphosphatase
VVDEDECVLLCRFDLTADGRPVVWAAPGGGIEPGESHLEALRRELDEEIGLQLHRDPPQVWHQQVVEPGHARGYDGVTNDYYLVRGERFEPNGSCTTVQLADEGISQLRWWSLAELRAYTGDEVFSPRELPSLLTALLASELPGEPLALGL